MPFAVRVGRLGSSLDLLLGLLLREGVEVGLRFGLWIPATTDYHPDTFVNVSHVFERVALDKNQVRSPADGDRPPLIGDQATYPSGLSSGATVRSLPEWHSAR